MDRRQTWVQRGAGALLLAGVLCSGAPAVAAAQDTTPNGPGDPACIAMPTPVCQGGPYMPPPPPVIAPPPMAPAMPMIPDPSIATPGMI